jgi:superfamily II DNA or RNA helicase
MDLNQLKSGAIVRGPVIPEPIQVVAVVPMGEVTQIMGKGLTTGQFHDPILSKAQVALLTASPEKEPFDGDARRFRLGIEAMRLGLAYEYDPYFSLSIARVDPLPHQLEAVYDYFMRLPRIRFLLADDPGAGKTIMAGLLIKELKIRGLIKRILIVAPANLTFQWQRELRDKFREQFEVIRGDTLRANYGMNPWQERDQVVTSVSWVSRIEDARESLLRSDWDLVIVDEAHKMSAYSADKKTLAYQLGEHLSEMTDHFLLMTATPHKGDPDNFRLFLELLDKDVYGDIESLEEAMREREAPFYLRRVKEALVTFPDPDTGDVHQLFTRRNVQTAPFHLNAEEMDFYDELTRYVEDQSIKASEDDSARGRALGFTMAMLQRRFASSVYAVRRSLERMKATREKILADPDAYRQEQILKRIPEDFEDLPDDEQQDIMLRLEEVVPSIDPTSLREEIARLSKLIDAAHILEAREIETKLTKLQDVITEQGVFSDPKMKLLIFTEHKDTLDYLVGKLEGWGLTVTQIHGGMKIGDRDAPGTRIYAERAFKESAQVLVATEAAGEGINLQFCWFMINYDIPWNPVRLEQRMGRIHRYGQEKDCLIINFVASNTREGRVMAKLFERIRQIEADLDPKQTGAVFNVLGDVFPVNFLERMVRDMYARNQTEAGIKERIVKEVDTERFRSITHSTLEGLAKRELNLSAILGRSAAAKERRLVPEVIEDFFLQASPIAGLDTKPVRKDGHTYRVGKVPHALWTVGERLEPRFGRLGREYGQIIFDKQFLERDPTLEWVTPGHPLFEAVRDDVGGKTGEDIQRGAVFYDIHRAAPARLDVFSGAVKDGRGNVVHRRIFVVEAEQDGLLNIRQPTLFLDLVAGEGEHAIPDDAAMPGDLQVKQVLIEQALDPLLDEVADNRRQETDTVRHHLEISLNALINRENLKYADHHLRVEAGEINLRPALKRSEERLEELNHRLETRLADLEKERHCTIADIQRHGRAWVLPHPERKSPGIASMVRDEEIERLAVEAVTAYENARGWAVESVEKDNRGFDLISRRPHPEDPATAIEVRFIEVKGRAAVGEIALTSNEYKTAERLKKDYWLYAVFNCAADPKVHLVPDPARLGWEPVVKVEHYHVGAEQILAAENKNQDKDTPE